MALIAGSSAICFKEHPCKLCEYRCLISSDCRQRTAPPRSLAVSMTLAWIWHLHPSIRTVPHSRQHQIWQLCKCISNAFIMFKYGNLFAIAANPFRNLTFVITFVHNTKVKHKLRICHEYKSEGLVDNKDLHVMQIPNLAKQLWCLHIYCLTPNLSMNWQNPQIDSHIQTLRMHCECICADFKFGAVCRVGPFPPTISRVILSFTH